MSAVEAVTFSADDFGVTPGRLHHSQTPGFLQLMLHPVDAQHMEPMIPALDAPARGVTTFTQSAGLKTHGFIERYRATIMTAVIIIMAFAVSIHFSDHGVGLNHLARHAPR